MIQKGGRQIDLWLERSIVCLGHCIACACVYISSSCGGGGGGRGGGGGASNGLYLADEFAALQKEAGGGGDEGGRVKEGHQNEKYDGGLK